MSVKQREHWRTLDQRMFDFHEFYQNMARDMPDDAVIAEVGVAEGASAIFLAESLLNYGKKFTFHMIDSLDYGHEDQLRTIVRNIGDAGLGSYVDVIPLSSVEAACRAPDHHYDFVFIDASHKTEETKADLSLWYQKVKIGGVLAGHDYNNQEGADVRYAVDLMVPRTYIPNPNNLEGPEDARRGRRAKGFEVIQTTKKLNVWKITKHPRLKIKQF